MAFPYTFFENFATGGKGLWDTEVDTASILDFPHYTDLARHGMAPYRGAYCMRIRANGGTTAAYLKEATSLDIAAAATLYLRWYFYLGKDFRMAASDKFSMMELESVSDTTTIKAVGLQRTGSNIEVWWNIAQATAAPSTAVIGTTTTALNRWFCIEMKAYDANGGANDGTIDVWIDDGAAGAQIGPLTEGAVVDGKLGLIGPDAGTSGTILFADFIADDAQIFADGKRFRPLNQWLIGASNHPLIGPGKFAIDFTDSSADGTCTIYDQDGVQTRLEPVTALRNATAKDFVPGHTTFEVSYGAYVVLTGAAPQAHMQIERGGLLSDAQYINRGLSTTKPLPQTTG
jgi:hypothetical protein